MSYDRNNNNRRGGGRFPPGSHHRQHSVLGYWVPLITLSTIAIGGIAAWIWSERSAHDEDEYPDEKPQRPPTGPGGSYPTQGAQPYSGPPPQVAPLPTGGQAPYQPPPGGEAAAYYGQSSSQTRDVHERTDESFIGRMSGIVRRTPSPQQFFDSASRQVAAAGAAAGAALSSIMEEDHNGFASYDDQGRHEIREDRRDKREEKEGFSDHERWSEEAEEMKRRNTIETESSKRIEATKKDATGKGKAKRTVAVVVSADTESFDPINDDGAYHTEHGSILSHLPAHHDPDHTDLFVLIYAPNLKALPPLDYAPSTLGSSYSQISTPAVTPGSELQSISPHLKAATNLEPIYDALYTQAASLVNDSKQILSFTTADGYVHMLRSLAPQLVYISDALAGREGETVAQLKGWVGHTILVAGDEGHGGLADTETETEDERKSGKKDRKRWYDDSPLVGLGKDVELVDAARVGDDWARRVFGRD